MMKNAVAIAAGLALIARCHRPGVKRRHSPDRSRSAEEGAMEGVLVSAKKARLDHHRDGRQRRRAAATASRPPN